MNDNNLREALASYSHNAWSGWMKYLFEKSELNNDGCVVIPKWAVDRWLRQSETPYSQLKEEEKQSDRSEADQMINIFESELTDFENKAGIKTGLNIYQEVYTLRYQLYRFGQAYGSWADTEQEVIDREVRGANKPWWWLRFLGWHVGKEILRNPTKFTQGGQGKATKNLYE